MKKLAYFFIDDVIFVMRDIARDKPESIFDNAFMKMLKRAHDEQGMTVQLNLFYRTDFFYGGEEFTLAQMPDTYKAEWESCSDWLNLAFHAKQEFPDYPYINATYEDVKKDYEQIANEVIRFAGEKSLSTAFCPHWYPVSRMGCKALHDCGVRVISPSYGKLIPYSGDPSTLPYGHSFRLLHNRQPETMLFTRAGNNTAITVSLAGYNHISEEENARMYGKDTSILDEETGLHFRRLCCGPCLNLETLESVAEILAEHNGNEYIGCAVHEQYFYEDYFAYQPDFEEKLYLMAKTLTEYGYRWITSKEIE